MILTNNFVQNDKIAFESRRPAHGPRCRQEVINRFTASARKVLPEMENADLFCGHTVTRDGTEATLYIIGNKPYVQPREYTKEVLRKFQDTYFNFVTKGKGKK